MKNQIVENNTGPKYSLMLMELVAEFERELPSELTYEDTLEVGIEAWNLANRKAFLVDKGLYENKLIDQEFRTTIEKMVDYKSEKFNNAQNMIIDYTVFEDRLQVKTQTYENFFNNLITQMINTEVEKD